MKKILSIFIAVTFVFVSLAGCQNAEDKTGEGAVVGGLLGATAGGIIGHQSGHGLEGAGIGAAAGALTGALIGSKMKKQPAQDSAQSGVNAEQMTMQQIVDLTKQGVHESVIIDRINLTHSKFTLNDADINYLKQQGVSENVIRAMQGL